MAGPTLTVRLAILWFASIFCAAAPVDGARAQSPFRTITTITPPPRATAERSRPPAAARSRIEPEAPFTLRPAMSPRPHNMAPEDDDSGLPGARLPGDPDPSTLDGGNPVGQEPRQPVDGVFAPVNPDVPVDGVNPAVRDHRSQEEKAAFDGPPVGFDPGLFSLETAPILDRRPRQLFRFEPYEPIGLRMGSLIVLPEIEFGATWQSNVFSAPNARADVSYDATPTVRVISNWRRHALEFRATGTFSSFQKFTSENARIYALELRNRLDVTKRTNIETMLSRDVTQEGRETLDAVPTALERANVTTDTAAAALNHRFNRLRLQIRGSVADTTYGSVPVVGGGTIASDRDVKTLRAAIRASWEFKPTLFAFVEAGLDHRDFKTVSAADNISRDSDGERYRAGLSFGTTGEFLRGEISVGYGRQTPHDRRLDSIDGILVDANLAWRPTRLTTVLLTAGADITDSAVAGTAGAFTTRYGAEIQHRLRRNVVLSAGLQRTIQDYSGISITERDWTGSVGVDYFINRNVNLFGRYRYVAFRSNDAGRDYDSDEIRVGVRLRR